jgi:hypothetical protein
MLDQVSFVGVVTKQSPVVLVLAALVLLFGIASGDRDGFFPALLIAGALVAFYFWLRRARLSVVSTSGVEIAVAVRGMSPDQVEAFVEAVERERWRLVGGRAQRAA